MSAQLLKAQSDAGMLNDAADEAAAKLLAQQLVKRRDAHLQSRLAQAHGMTTQHSAMDRAPPARNAGVKRMHMINQPRRFN
jgi:hypothetical protein